jgi:hypothetical protein
MGFCQDEPKNDSVRVSFKPTGIRVGWDALSTARSFASKNFTGWEINGDVDFRNYYLAIEVGHWERQTILENGEYSNTGNYWRAGIDINTFKKDPMKNMLFLGFRLGHSDYNEQLYYTDSTAFGMLSRTLVNQGMKSNWAELTTGIKIKILKNFWMGYTARMKFFASYNKNQTLQSYDIPGYGLTYKKPWWGFNYYLMYRIPIRKEKLKN